MNFLSNFQFLEVSFRRSRLRNLFRKLLRLCIGGVVQVAEAETGFKHSFVDPLPVIDVKYVSFAGYRGAHTKVTFDCVTITTTDKQIADRTTIAPLAENDDANNEILK